MTKEDKFYVYKWYNIKTGEVFYIGKGSNDRYLQTRKRNKLFQEYIENNKVKSEIIKNNLSEKEAFILEAKLIAEYRNKNQCSCNLSDGGHGGCHFVWTDQMKKYWSKNNPMKEEKQRQRMRENNPMKNPEIAKRVGKKHKRPIVVQGVRYDGLVDAAKVFNVAPNTIGDWVKKGYDTPTRSPCYYADKKCKYKEEDIPIKKKPNLKPVLIDDILYESGVEAAKALGVSGSAIYYAIKHNGKCKGHICKYANQQPS